MSVEATQLHAVVGAFFSRIVCANYVSFLQFSLERPKTCFLGYLINQSVMQDQWQMPITFRHSLVVKHFMDFHTYIAQPAINMSDCPFIPKTDRLSKSCLSITSRDYKTHPAYLKLHSKRQKPLFGHVQACLCGAFPHTSAINTVQRNVSTESAAIFHMLQLHQWLV